MTLATPTGTHNWSEEELVSGMLDRQEHAVAAIRAIAPSLSAAIGDVVPRLAAGGRLIFSGAGTSGRLAAQDAAELPPTFNWPRARAVALIAGGLDALHTPVERAEDNAQAGRDDMLALHPGPNDIAVGVAASGTTPYTIATVQAAREAGALTIAVCNRAGSPLTEDVDHALAVETGPEFVHGSTRLAAGTAQKIVLNVLTTATMVRLGRVYQGHMVEMPPTNAKLEARAISIVMDVAGCTDTDARAALAAANNSVKIAIVMLIKELSSAQATELLDQCGGSLRDVF